MFVGWGLALHLIHFVQFADDVETHIRELVFEEGEEDGEQLIDGGLLLSPSTPHTSTPHPIHLTPSRSHLTSYTLHSTSFTSHLTTTTLHLTGHPSQAVAGGYRCVGVVPGG